MTIWKKACVESMGTFWLTFCGCGVAILSAKFASVGVGILGVSFAFGLSVVTFAYAFASISGAHFNPAISLGCFVAGKLKINELFIYIISQVIGAILAAFILCFIASGYPGFDLVQSGFATNGYGSHSPGNYSLEACFLIEVLMTFIFTLIVLGSTSKKSNSMFAPLAIGFALTLIHLVSIPITNTSVNPARSTGPALVYGGPALKQLWLFWIAPLLGAFLAGIKYKLFFQKEQN